MIKVHNILSIILILSLLACNTKKTDQESIANESIEKSSISNQPTIVKTTPATTTTFTLQKILNGSIEADRKTTIKSEAAGFITAYHLREGTYVKKGALLLSLDDQELQLQLQQRRNELDDAITARNERFVGDGGQVDDESSVPPEKLEIINVLTGYNKALTAIRQTEFSLSRKKI